MKNNIPLFQAADALSGLRDSGIKSTASAIAEIVDNSIDAKSKNIEILVREEPTKVGARQLDKITTIYIGDDGEGMSQNIMEKCLSVGGRDDENHHADHIGRFGYGLPNSSLSQCKRVEVYSWQKKDVVNYTYLDFDEIKKNNEQYCKPVSKKDLPENIKKEFSIAKNQSGTIIIWSKCDRIDIAKGDTLFRHMQGDLCRIFRHRLDNDNSYGRKVKINYRILNSDFNERLVANDPIYILTPNTCPKYENEATNQIVYNKKIPIKYWSDKESKIKSTFITLIYTLSKPSIQALGGASPTGKHYAKNTGISVVRQAREITFGTFGFFDRFEQRNRWWGCEIRYDGDGTRDCTEGLDNVFGLTNNKQELTKFYFEDLSDLEERHGELLEDLKENDLSLQMRLTISKIFSDLRSENYKIILSRGSGTKGGKTGKTSDDIANKVLENNKTMTRSYIEGQNKSQEQKVEEWKKIIKAAEPELTDDQINQEINSRLPKKVSIEFGEWPGEQFFTVRLAGDTAVGLINRDHSYYRDFYDKLLKKDDSNDIKTIDLLLMAFVRMEDENYSIREDIEKMRNKWGRYLQDFLEELKKSN